MQVQTVQVQVQVQSPTPGPADQLYFMHLPCIIKYYNEALSQLDGLDLIVMIKELEHNFHPPEHPCLPKAFLSSH